jgi:NADPH-dependent glutamate synthase beta subunit-like oxidoreductase
MSRFPPARTVAIVGGGNVAMGRHPHTAIRLGADKVLLRLPAAARET